MDGLDTRANAGELGWLSPGAMGRKERAPKRLLGCGGPFSSSSLSQRHLPQLGGRLGVNRGTSTSWKHMTVPQCPGAPSFQSKLQFKASLSPRSLKVPQCSGRPCRAAGNTSLGARDRPTANCHQGWGISILGAHSLPAAVCFFWGGGSCVAPPVPGQSQLHSLWSPVRSPCYPTAPPSQALHLLAHLSVQ